MKTFNPRKQAFNASRLLLTSSTLALFTSGAAHAQQVIIEGDNITVTSVADGETISAAAGVASTVEGAPVVVVANNDVTVDNAGTLATTGVTQTIQVNQGTTGTIINNAATGRLEGASRVVNFDGTDATLNNEGVILGTGSQRNGAVYANRTSNNIVINNGVNGVIDAGVEGAGVAIEVGGGGMPITGEINNAGVISGRGQAPAMGGTAGDGIRFFGPGVAPAYIYEGTINNSGLITSDSEQGTVAAIRFANRIGFQGELNNTGEISGVRNGLYFGDADHTGGVVNNDGQIISDSRALNIDGTGLVVNNFAVIAGSGNQRNGTVYADSTAQDFEFNNFGLVDPGLGNNGAGFSAELSAEGNNFTINNEGNILGDSVEDSGSPLAGDGIRFERERVNGVLDGTTSGLFTGTINNSETGAIASLGGGGTTAGIRFVNGVSFSGTINNDGFIGGVSNGLYFGNATPAGGGDFTGAVVNNSGTIESESRALNIDGLGLTINNSGSILGAGNQRNGTVYADSTAQGFVLNNLETGVIDAGMGNEGAGFSVELSAEGNDFTIVNAGIIQGRGQADAGAATAGDGLRFERERVGGILEGSTTGLFTGTIENSGLINSESAQGTTAGIRFVNGASFQGVLNNSGTISGVQNGVYFGNPVPAGGADHTGGVVNNLDGGVISSDSRAFNIDGLGLTLNNAGSILGTGDQRNGTVYADGTADNFTVNNSGVIDAGMGNEGSGFGAEIGGAADGANTFDLVNSGTIQGRGQASAAVGGAGDGVRIGNVGNIGVFDGTITNSGTIASESMQGTTAGIRFVNGISFQGTLTNETGGVISGVQNGLYFGNPVMGMGADHTGGVVNNAGTISSDSRALNIDGFGLTVNNTGSILGTGNQRNGTVYADGTADDFAVNNSGVIDAGMGNNGSGFGAEIGGAADGANTFSLTNTGSIQGRGQAGPMDNQAGDGVRIGNAGNMGTFDGTIINSGTINSESMQGPVAGIRVVNGVNLAGSITNSGTISGGNHGIYLGAGDHTGAVITNSGILSGGVNAFFAGNALSAVNVVNDGGTLIGNFVGSSAFEDTLSITGMGNSIQGNILNTVAVTTAAGSTTDISGARTLDGRLTHNGTLSFDLDVDSLAVDGDTVLGMGSVINVATDQIGQADVGRTIDILTETGSFTNNGVSVNVADNDFLIDYDVVFGSVAVAVNAADLGNVSADANISSFGSAITSATANNRLTAPVFDALNGVDDAAGFEALALDLLPAINDGVTREIFETQRFAISLVQDRLRQKGTGLWGEAFFRNADAEGTSVSSLGYNADATGFTLGLDGQISETVTVGVLANYADIELEAAGTAGARSQIDAFQIGAYAGFDLGQAYANAELGYSTNSVDSSRTALGSVVTGDSNVDGLYASLNVGYDVDAGSVAVTPSVGLRYADLSRDTFTETGGLGLSLDSDNAQFLETRLGVRVSGTAQTGVIPFTSVDYAYDLSSDPIAVAGSFNGGADTFTVVADEASASRFDFAAGFDFVSEGGLTVGAEYRGRFASGYQSHAGGVRVRFQF